PLGGDFCRLAGETSSPAGERGRSRNQGHTGRAKNGVTRCRSCPHRSAKIGRHRAHLIASSRNRALRILLSLPARPHQKQMAAKRPVARQRKRRAPRPTCVQFATFRPPPHDRRAHRYQKRKAPLSAEELKEKGVTKM